LFIIQRCGFFAISHSHSKTKQGDSSIILGHGKGKKEANEKKAFLVFISLAGHRKMININCALWREGQTLLNTCFIFIVVVAIAAAKRKN
jgi:hypothetical protein